MKIEILSPGERLAKLRKAVGLKQRDLASDGVSEGLISMIENNKRVLTYKVATAIAATLNQYYRHLDEEITPELLMESEKDQATKMILEKLEMLKPHLEARLPSEEETIRQSFNWLINFALEWELEEMVALIRETRGRYLCGMLYYEEALKEFIASLEYYLSMLRYDHVVFILNYIGICYYHMKLFKQAMTHYNKAYQLVEMHQPVNQKRMRQIIMFNRILCFYQLKQFYQMSKLTDYYYRNYPVKHDEYYDVVLINGMKYRDTYEFDKATEAFDEILANKYVAKLKTILLTYENYAELYQMKADYEKSLRYISRSYQYQTRLDLHYIPNLYLNEAKSYFELGQVNKALSLLQKGIILAEKVSRFEVFLQLCLYRAQVYFRNGEYQRAEEQLKELESRVLERQREDMLSLIYLNLVQLYCKWNRRDSCLSYTTKLIDASNQNRH